jgi:hypothetical protein
VQQEWKIDNLVDALIEREGGYVRHRADRGGPTCFGITEAVARAHGYAGPMRQLPRSEAAAIYRRLYWARPCFDRVAERSAALAAELFDTGVNMGPSVAVLAAAAGMFCGACAVAMIGLLMWGRWSAAEEHTIVTIFGWSLGGFIAAMVAVIVGLLAGGPVGRFKVSASHDGASIEADNP